MNQSAVREIYVVVVSRRNTVKVEYLGNDKYSFEYRDGFKSWWLNGERHRTAGPAIKWTGNIEEWWLNGNRLTEEEFNEKQSN